jgi:hypothetical protein
MRVVAEDVLALLEPDRELVAGRELARLAGAAQGFGLCVAWMASGQRDAGQDEKDGNSVRARILVRRDSRSHERL